MTIVCRENDKEIKLLNILIVVTRMDTGGVPEHILMLVRGLSKKGHKVSVLCDNISKRYEDEFFVLGVEIILVALSRLPNPFSDIRIFFKLIKIMKSGGYDVVHTHMSKAVMLGAPAAKLARIPVVVNTAHNVGWLALSNPVFRVVFWLYDSLLFRLAMDSVITVSDLVKKGVVEAHIAPESKVYAVANGIDTPIVPSETALLKLKNDLAVNDDTLVVITVARLVWFKGINTLMDAASLVVQEIPNVFFVVVGDGDKLSELQAQVNALGIQKQVAFLGERDDVPALLSISDLFALPSVSEGMPISILEAMALSKTVVATSVGGVPELVIPGETGMLVKKGDSKAMANAIITLLKDKEFRLKLGRTCKEHHQKYYSTESMVVATEAVYLDLLEK